MSNQVRSAQTDSKVVELHSRAEFLVAKFEQGGGTNYIDEAIVLDREALELRPPGHPKRYVSLAWLNIHLSDRYNQLGVLADIEESISLGRDTLGFCTVGHPDRSTALNNLGVRLCTRYNQLGAMEDLNEAIVLARDALALHPPGHPHHSMLLNTLAGHLYSRYNQLGAMEDLNESIDLVRDALILYPRWHPVLSMSLNNLSLYLSTRYDRLGAMQDLNEAIVLSRHALELRPSGHPLRSSSLNNNAICLSTRYKQLGAIGDLNEAIVLGRDVLALHPPGHPDRSMALNNLSLYLSTRYDQLETIEDLNEAIVFAREALALCPSGHPFRSMSLDNLGVYLSTRYHHARALDDLNESIVLGQDALTLRPPGHPGRSGSLHNLAARLFIRYNELKATKDLNEVVALARDALVLLPPVHPDRSTCSGNLALYLSCRYEHLGEVEDLNEAIALARNALELRPPGHPERSQSLNNLARHLCVRFMKSSQLMDKEELFNLFSQLAHPLSTVSSNDLSAARKWILAAEHFYHPTTLLAYQTALRILTHHVATLPPLPQHRTVLQGLTSSLAVDTFSASLRNHSFTHAVALLEQGRGVFWSQLTRLRSSLDDVIASGSMGKMLANEFTQKTLLIRTALDSPGPGQHDRVCRLNVELQTVITRIRKLPGLSRFLLPSLFPDLQQAAREGPVIIVNASKYGCDALVVLVDQNPVHIPLSITKHGVRDLSSKLGTLTVRAKSMDVTRELAIILRELWDEVVSPIVNFLQTIHPFRSRIWWCPTAEFSLLPLHAAGPYRTGQRNLANLYISSYTPTLTALIRARRHDPANSVSKGSHFVGIGQAKAKGENELVSVGAELADIQQRVGGVATFTHIEGKESCIARVTEELGRNEWVHLACHGIPNRAQPFESAFALHDGHFTIERIIRCEPQNAKFAYLSACHTTVGDEDSPDEVIHLASAMQFAGFRSVIGTMWAVDDAQTNKITSAFYGNMINESGRLDYTRAAFALNKAMKKLADVPFDQRILYIHLGA